MQERFLLTVELDCTREQEAGNDQTAVDTHRHPRTSSIGRDAAGKIVRTVLQRLAAEVTLLIATKRQKDRTPMGLISEDARRMIGASEPPVRVEVNRRDIVKYAVSTYTLRSCGR